jgi:hypothetical protein
MIGNIIQLTPINGISANLLKIDTKQAIGIDLRME